MQGLNAPARGTGIALIGARGAGKSTVGRLLGLRLKRTFLDLDYLVEESAGAPLEELWETVGEAGFRRLESQALIEACRLERAIIATGGGAVLDQANRQALRAHGAIFYLEAGAEVLGRRLDGDERPRPVLTPELEPHEEVAALLAKREPIYRELADVRVKADQTPNDVASDIIKGLDTLRWFIPRATNIIVP